MCDPVFGGTHWEEVTGGLNKRESGRHDEMMGCGASTGRLRFHYLLSDMSSMLCSTARIRAKHGVLDRAMGCPESCEGFP
jgi:hypothetical protein